MRLVPHVPARRLEGHGRSDPDDGAERQEPDLHPRVDRQPERSDRAGLPAERDAADVRRAAVQQAARGPRRLPAALIDIRAARAEPDSFRAAIARRGAAEAFDEAMDADRRWLGLVPKVDEL